MRLSRLAVLAWVLAGRVLPSGVDARTNGGLYEPGPGDRYHTGQWGVTDHRARSQGSWTFRLSGPPE